MARRHTITFWAGITLCLLIGSLTAVTELIAGTRLDTLAEHWATKH